MLQLCQCSLDVLSSAAGRGHGDGAEPLSPLAPHFLEPGLPGAASVQVPRKAPSSSRRVNVPSHSPS